MEKKTVFEVFGIENRETKVSNLFAYYINTSRAFLNLLCDCAGISVVDESKKVTAKTEFPFKLEVVPNKNNFIDILVLIGDDPDKPERIICIENKIYAGEGYYQTERYQKGMEAEFPNSQRHYIYLTKNNSAIRLSSTVFEHVRYMDLIENIKADKIVKSLEFIDDFCEFYYEKELIEFQSIEKGGSIADERQFIDYFVWKANTEKQYSNLFVCSGNSAKGGNPFIKLSDQSWFVKSHLFGEKFEKCEMCLHLEGNSKNIKLHFETYPYRTIEDLKKDGVLEEYVKIRDAARKDFADRFKDISVDGVKMLRPANNAALTLVKFELKGKTSVQSFDKWMEILAAIRDTVANVVAKVAE